MDPARNSWGGGLLPRSGEFCERGTRSMPSAGLADSGGLGVESPAGSRGRAPGRGLGGGAPGNFLKNRVPEMPQNASSEHYKISKRL